MAFRTHSRCGCEKVGGSTGTGALSKCRTTAELAALEKLSEVLALKTADDRALRAGRHVEMRELRICRPLLAEGD